ncbi:hypothetical protein [Nocardia wallacei]|uniref:hypothetical protein n=1 Tax=Nocardia wallacei TaxID=480035 RepID=UPI0024553296|nr:hypothetical protein [Nocardia wallacei]
MARERVVDVYVPVIAPSGSGFGGVGAIFAVAGGAILVAVGLAVAVSCADFGDGPSQTVTTTRGTCAPFCTPQPGVIHRPVCEPFCVPAARQDTSGEGQR